MWTCPRCERVFKTANQSHSCGAASMDDIFAGKQDNVVLAFDRVLEAVVHWDPMHIGPAKRAVVFTKRKAWMIARPAVKWLDLIVSFEQQLAHPRVHKTRKHYSGKKYEHIIRLHSEEELNMEVIQLLERAYQAS